MRRFGKVDRNQEEIVAALRAIGCSVHSTASIGGGFPDLTVGRHGRTYLLEIKDGEQIPSKQKLTTDEKKFFDEWRGHAVVVKSVGEAIEAVRDVT